MPAGRLGRAAGPFPEALSGNSAGQGRNARLRQQKQTIEGELVSALLTAADRPTRAADETYAAEVRPLSWSNPAIASAVRAAAAHWLEVDSIPAPRFCADARAWAQSGYRALSAASRRFEASREARRKAERAQDPERLVDKLLKPYENASDRALIRKSEAAESEAFARAFATLGMFLKVARIVGFPETQTKEPKRVVLGHGRTAIGTRYEVSTGSGLFGRALCRRSATVAYSRAMSPEILVTSGPTNPICLSSHRYRRPALFCEEGIETIQSAVPASVYSVTLVLADGRRIRSRVIRIPRRDGGPAGVYAQEIRGSTSHAVSLVETTSGGDVVLSVRLPGYRCVKRPRQSHGAPTLTRLAGGRAPEGEPFTISALGGIGGDPFLSVDAGVDPEVGVRVLGAGASKAFPWQLSIGCAPHPFAILYGILAPPGTSVVAHTPHGAVPLNVVPVPPSVHAKGPLAYGVFDALPSELTVLGTSGSTIYSESLRAEATEAAQFCEGYAEP